MKLCRSFLGFAIACSSVATMVAACGDDETTISPAGTDSGTGSETSTTNPGDDGSTTQQDTGGGTTTDAGLDGEAITDGGANIDPDAGDDDDAGLDAAVCNALVNEAPAVTSECISVAPIFGGGALVAGKYFLKSVRLHAPPAFCQNTFQPTTFKTTMELTVDGNGVGTANTIVQVGNNVARSRTVALDPPDANTSPLVATPTCPARNPGNTAYLSGIRNNKQVLVLRGAYGNGTADFHYEKQ